MDALEPIEAEGRKGLETVIEGVLRGYATFEAYREDRWGISRGYAHRTIQAAQVTALFPIGNIPRNEAVARELVPLKHDPVQLARAWGQATEIDPEPPAKKVRKVVKTVAELAAGPQAMTIEEVAARKVPERVWRGIPRYRSPLASLEQDIAYWAVYRHIDGLRQLSRPEWRSTRTFQGYGKPSPYKRPFEPEGPLLVEPIRP